MELAGREWLCAAGAMPTSTPVDGALYSEAAGPGGYDECFPTVSACHLPYNAGGYAGLALPDHGELWSQRAQMRIATPTTAMEAASIWHGRRMQYRFTRRVRVLPDGSVEMRYEVLNEGAERIPFIWSAQPCFPLTAGTRIHIADGSRARVRHSRGLAMGAPGAEHRWPHFRLERQLANMSRPESVARSYECRLFVELSPQARDGDHMVAIEEHGIRLEARFDGDEITAVGVRISRPGWKPFRGGDRLAAERHTVSLEPCIGGMDSLADALAAQSARWLPPGETRSWRILWTGVPAPTAATGESSADARDAAGLSG